MKKQIIIGLSLLACVVLKAQMAPEASKVKAVQKVRKAHKTQEDREPGSYLHFNVGGGLHDFSYDLTNGTKQTAKIGYTVNAAYSYFFTSHWGFQTGIGAQTINGLSTLNYQSTVSAVDINSRTYDFRTNYKGWQEKQEAIFFDVPLVLQYRHSIGKNFGIIGSAGGKVSIPVYQRFKSTNIGEIVTTGYYSQWNLELSDLPQYGFTTISNSYKGNLSLKTAYMGVADLGGLIRLSDKTDLYIGGYVNYGLNNILKSGAKEVYQSDGAYNGVFASAQTTKVIPISFGVKVGVYLKMGKKDSDGDGVSDRKDKCSGTPKEAYGKIDKNGCPLDSDGDGVPDYLDKCPNTPKAAKGMVDKKGCPLDSDGDGVFDYLDKCPTIPGLASNKGCPEIKKEVKALFKKALQGIQFATGKSDIKPISFNLLNQIAVMLIANPTYIIEIQGHTDNVGKPANNLILSDKRAEAVKNYLINARVDANRLTSRGYGDTVPVTSNATPKGKALNRRVEFVVTFEKVTIE